MLSAAIFLVMMSGFLNAMWNLFAKQSSHPRVFLWSMQVVATLAYLPWALTAFFHLHHTVPPWGWICLAGSALLHGIYVILLSRTYQLGDLSQVYPLLRGVSPLLVPLIGVVILGERFSVWGELGAVGIVLGIGMLGRWGLRKQSGEKARELYTAMIAFTAGLSIAAYTSFDKVTLHYIPPIILNDGANVGNLFALSWWVLRSHGIIAREWQAHPKTIVLGGIVAPASYLLFLMALRMSSLTQIAPMREISIVFASLFGLVILKEPQGCRRLAASAIIAAGVIMLGVWGR